MGRLAVPVRGKGIQVYELIASRAASLETATATSGDKDWLLDSLVLIAAGDVAWAVAL